MSLLEFIKPEEVETKLSYNDHLNPALWDDYKLKPEVKKTLLEIATLFKDFLKIPNIKISDIVLTGSNANYNWTDLSDIDLHLIIDMDSLKKEYAAIIDDYFQDKKKIWNDTHDMTIYKFPIELYAQDAAEPHVSTGVYSLLHDKWVKKPSYNPPEIDDTAVKVKAAEIMNQIDAVGHGDCSTLPEIEKIKKKIKKMRNSGLLTGGEFSTENLVFKTLRNTGYLEKLSDSNTKALDSCYTLV